MAKQIVAGVALVLAGAGTAHAAGDVVISQVYGGGGNSNAPLQNDFVELFNRSSAPVSISGWSVQYASATGTGNFGGNPAVGLSGTLQPGQYYLIKLAGGTVGAALPAADATVTSLNMSGASGKVALVNSSAGLACNGGSAPCSAAQLAQIVDLVGYGGANFFENAPTATLTNGTAAIRLNDGCTDTNINNADFTIGAPAPRNTASPLSPCGGTANAPVVASCPATLPTTVGTEANANLSANDADGVVSTAAITSAAVAGITLINVVPGNPLTAQLRVAASVAAGNYPTTVTFSNADATPQTATCTVAVNVAPPVAATRIHDIQGAAHISPLNGQSVGAVPGIVTALKSNGFYLQDPNPDANPATSEAIFVFTNSAPTVSAGDSVQVAGKVAEFRAGGASGLTNLTTTEIDAPVVTLISSGNALPAPIVLGAGGRAIPPTVIEDDATGDVETSGTFDPATDGIDFFESLEGMRVQIDNAVVVGPTNSFGEIAVVADGGAGAAIRSVRGGVIISATNDNPQRMFLDDTLLPTPVVNVGDTFAGPITAIVDYSFGNFKFDITSPVTAVDNGLTPEQTALVGTPSQLTVGSFNVENLAPGDPPAKFAALANEVVSDLRSPDVLALMEIQDNNGTTNNGLVDATTTFNLLIAAIHDAGGPAYQFREIDPVDGADGGAGGGNIRVGFLFNPARVSFVDRAGGGSTVATTVMNGPNGPQLSSSPGRIDPTNSAFANSRKPLAGEFLFNGRRLFVIANHFVAKLADDPLYGHVQPPVRSSEIQRHRQAAIVNGFVKSILALDANASVVVLGDLNDFEFSDTLTVLKDGALFDLAEALPPSERYGYVFEGNSQVLDHILVSNALATFAHAELDFVHVNAEFAAQTSDHDPDVLRVQLPKAGDVDGDGDVDRADVDAIIAARNTPASGPYDPRNLNNDTRIDALDARLAVTACTRPGCAVQ